MEPPGVDDENPADDEVVAVVEAGVVSDVG